MKKGGGGVGRRERPETHSPLGTTRGCTQHVELKMGEWTLYKSATINHVHIRSKPNVSKVVLKLLGVHFTQNVMRVRNIAGMHIIPFQLVFLILRPKRWW